MSEKNSVVKSCVSISLGLNKVRELLAEMKDNLNSGDRDTMLQNQKKLEGFLSRLWQAVDKRVALFMSEKLAKEEGGFGFCFASRYGISWIVNQNHAEMLVNTKGESLTGPVEISESGNDSYIIKKTGNSLERFFVDYKGNRIEGTYQIIKPFSDGYAVVVDMNARYYFIDKNYKKVFRQNGFQGAKPFHNGIAAVRERDSVYWILIDQKGKKILNLEFDEAGEFSEGLIPVKYSRGLLKQNATYIDIKGQIQFNLSSGIFSYYTTRGFHDGLAAINRLGPDADGKYDIANRKWYFYNKIGQTINETGYHKVNDFSYGMALVQEEEHGKWHYINTKGEILFEGMSIRPGVEEFYSDGLAPISDRKGGLFYIDREGNFYPEKEITEKRALAELEQMDIRKIIEEME